MPVTESTTALAKRAYSAVVVMLVAAAVCCRSTFADRPYLPSFVVLFRNCIRHDICVAGGRIDVGGDCGPRHGRESTISQGGGSMVLY